MDEACRVKYFKAQLSLISKLFYAHLLRTNGHLLFSDYQFVQYFNSWLASYQFNYRQRVFKRSILQHSQDQSKERVKSAESRHWEYQSTVYIF